jgi:hypothetical protein
MCERGSFDLSKINKPSDITREVIRKLSAKDAIYLREKFGDQLDSLLVFKEIAEEFTLEDAERLKSFESKGSTR